MAFLWTRVVMVTKIQGLNVVIVHTWISVTWWAKLLGNHIRDQSQQSWWLKPPLSFLVPVGWPFKAVGKCLNNREFVFQFLDVQVLKVWFIREVSIDWEDYHYIFCTLTLGNGNSLPLKGTGIGKITLYNVSSSAFTALTFLNEVKDTPKYHAAPPQGFEPWTTRLRALP